jgi:hypothetical protein
MNGFLTWLCAVGMYAGPRPALGTARTEGGGQERKVVEGLS